MLQAPLTPILFVGPGLQVVVETPAYLSAATVVLSEADRAMVVDAVARYPEQGVSLGGGIRKARLARPVGGKRSGVRVVSPYRGAEVPVYLLMVFAKNERSDLSEKERRALVIAARTLTQDHRRRK